MPTRLVNELVLRALLCRLSVLSIVGHWRCMSRSLLHLQRTTLPTASQADVLRHQLCI